MVEHDRTAYHPGRDERAVAKFVETFGLVLTDAGMQRTAARAFSALLVSESGNLTAREIAEAVQVSPAAVSGAVRYLEHAGLIRREREPGRRVDHFVIGDDFWYQSMISQSTVFDAMTDALDAGIAAVGRTSNAGQRLEETQDFFAYLRRELPRLFTEWRASRG